VFLPRDYDLAAFVDVDALLESGLYDMLERSMMRPLMESFARVHGFYLSELEAFHWAQRTVVDEDGWPDGVSVMVFEGSEKVGLAGVDPDQTGYAFEATGIGGHAVLTDAGVETWVSPKPGSLVVGDARVVDATLRGEHHGGVPVPDLLALTARPGTIAYFGGMLPEDVVDAGSMEPIPAGWLEPEDPPHAVLLRIERGDASDAAPMRLSFRIRFRNGEGGAELFAREFDAWMSTLSEDPRLRLLSRTLRETKSSVDHSDFIATLDLDQPERVFSIALNAFGSLAFIAMREFQVLAPGPVVVVPVEVPVATEDEPEGDEPEKGEQEPDRAEPR
jgi:hypothetical protein